MTSALRVTRRLAVAAMCGCIAALTAAFTAPSGPPSPPASVAARATSSVRAQAASQAAVAAVGPLLVFPGRQRLNLGPGERLLDVSAASAHNAWVLGQIMTSPSFKDVLLHWNGASWSQVTIPGASANGVADVTAVSAGNAWLVGAHCTRGCAAQTTLIMHWNGTAWSRVASPNPAGKVNFLDGVSALSAGNAWAVGSTCSITNGGCAPLMLHWNGTRWSQAASPAPGESDKLVAVATVAGGHAWAAGIQWSGGCCVPLVMHWNGTRWSQAVIPPVGPGGVFGLAATYARDVWAVGDTGAVRKPVIFHWNGARWSTVASPNSGLPGAFFGVAAISSRDAWAVGESCTSARCLISNPLIAHWNGRTWSRVGSPRLGTGVTLADVAATSSSNAWAVGFNCNGSGSRCGPILLRWNGKAWVKA